MHICKFIFFLSLNMAVNMAFAVEEEPPFFKATYKLFSSGLEIAHMERNLHKQGDEGYIYSSITNTVGLVAMFHKDHIVEVSQWKIIDNHILPLNYTYTRNRGKKNRKINIDFDWANKVINNVVNEKYRQMPLQTGMLDKLLYQYALMRDLRNNQAEIAYEVTDGGKMKKYNFARMGDEIVQTPLGPLQAAKLQRIKHDDQSRLIIWAAPSLKYLPVKVESTDEDGRSTTALIQTLSWF